MGSSVRKKKEKKRDFQKPKLKVGKAKPKTSNFTDTSFKSKSIVINQQLPTAGGHHDISYFKHNLSLASTGRSDSQRADGLLYLTNQLSSTPPYNPVGGLQVLLKVLPLISDGSSAVRSQLLKLLKVIPISDIKPYVEKIVLYVRAGITNLSTEISQDSLSVMEWLLDIAAEDVVSAPGCWIKPLSCFVSVLRWSVYIESAAASGNGWSAAPQVSLGSIKKKQAHARHIAVLARFLKAGFTESLIKETQADSDGTYVQRLYCSPREPNAFAHLNVFGSPRDEDSQMYMDKGSRQRIFLRRFHKAVTKGLEEAKKEGGSVGRAAATLDKVLQDGMDEYTSAVDGVFDYSIKGLTTLW